MSRQNRQWHVFLTADALIGELLARIAACSSEALRERGAFHIVLAGGTTPRRFYEQLVSLQTDWSRWHIWFGDERCLPAGDPERNDTMAGNAWLDRVAIPPQQIHAIPAELGAQAAAEAYDKALVSREAFDLVLLGLGEDGHTASLFPGHDLGEGPGAPAAIAVEDAPKPPPERVSLSARRLSFARHVWFIVTGESKPPAMRRWQEDENIPASVVVPPSAVEIFTDRVEFQPESPRVTV